jgi:hypothetical protein
LACNLGAPSTAPATPANSGGGGDDGTTPSIVIEAPPNGSQSYLGGRVEVRVRATDSIGIDRVEMRDSGRIVVSQPSPERTTDFTALLTYRPSYIGTVTLEVVAVRRNVISPPATLVLQIVSSVNDLDNPGALDPTTGVSSGAACTLRVRINTLNLRAGPGTAYPILAKLPLGEDLTVTGRNEASSWYQIRRAGGTTGWVSAQYVEPTGDCSRAPIVNAP